MPFSIKSHDETHFHAEGARGPFKIAKKGLTKTQRDRYIALCNGGAVKPQKLAEGGEVDPATAAPAPKSWAQQAAEAAFEAGQAVTGAARGMVGDSLGRYALDPAVAAVRSVAHGTPYSDELSRLAVEEQARADQQPSSLMGDYDARTRQPGESVQDHARRATAWSLDPSNPAVERAMNQAMMFAGSGPVRAPAGAATAAATAAEQAAAAVRARGGTHAATEARFGMIPGVTAAESAQALAAARGAGTYLDPAVLAVARQKISEAANLRTGRTGVGLVPWDNMSLPEAQAAARDRAHLATLDSGQYIGGPSSIKNPQQLAALRAKIDKLVAKGSYGANWYERARNAVAEISNSDPKMADQLSEVLAIYSPQATPDTNFGWAIEQANRTALEGADKAALWAPKTQVQADKAAKAFKGEEQDLGPKAGVYEQHINPNKAQEAQVRGVNDLWQGRIFGYPEVKDTEVGRGLAAKAGFTDAQHSFMTGENLQAALRAQEKGLLPPGVDPNVGNIQAATWVAQREAKLRSDWAKRASAAKEAGKPAPKKLSDAEIRRRASQSYDTVLDKYTGNETYETVPGRKVEGHLSGIQDRSLPERAAYTDATAWAPVGAHDPIYQALGMPSRPTQAGLGQFGADFNPNRAAKPMVSYEPGRIPTFDEAGKPITKLNSKGKAKPVTAPNTRKGVNAPDETMINNANIVRSVVDAQDAGAWNAPRLSGGGKNAARVRFPSPLDEAATRNLYAQAKAAGLDLIDTGGGTFTVAGDLGSGGSMDAARFGQLLKGGKSAGPGMGDALAGARVDRGSFQGGYNEIPWGAEGSGQVTEYLLQSLDPRVEAKLDASQAFRAKVGEKAVTDLDMHSKLGTGRPRADIQKIRGMISAEGLAGLRAYVAKNGAKGLPAVLLPLIYEGMQQSPQAGEQRQQFAHGGTVQHFDAGGVAQGIPAGPQASFDPGVGGFSPAPPPAPPVFPAQNPLAGQAPYPTTMPPPGWAPVPGDPTLGTPVPGPYDPTADSIDSLLARSQASRTAPSMTPAAPEQPGTIDPMLGFVPDPQPRPSLEQTNANALKANYDQTVKMLGKDKADAMFAGQNVSGATAPAAPAAAPAAKWAPPNYAAMAGGVPRPAAPASPRAPGGGGGGGGLSASGEIADASKTYQRASDEKAATEELFLRKMADMKQQSAVDLQALNKQSQERYQQRLKTGDAMFEEIRNAKISPNQFFESRDSWQKVSMGIGMLLSGIGSGLNGQPNMAMHVIQSAIDRDIDAQKANLAKGQNLYAYFVKQTGDELAAQSELRATLLSSVAAQIESQQAGMTSASHRQNSLMNAQQFRMQSAQARAQTSLHEAQTAQVSYTLALEKRKMALMEQMLGAGPGAALNGDHTQLLQMTTQYGIHDPAHISYEEMVDPVRRADGKPEVDATGAPILDPKSKRVVWRLMGSPDAAKEANTTFANINSYRPDVEAALGILAANPSGTALLQNPQANQALKQHMARVISGYEQTVGGVNRMPSEGVVKTVEAGLGNPGGVADTLLGQSSAALRVVLQQLDARAHAIRVQARY